MSSLSPLEHSATGIPGLDFILKGGFPANRLYLLKGEPGTGKTTMALQYLLEGVRRGEKCLYIALSETKDEIMEVGRSHGWSFDGLSIFELSALESLLAQESQNTVFHPSEIELNKTTELLLKTIDEVKPQRLVIDSLSELRLLSDSGLRYRRQMLSFKQYFAGQKITVILLDDHGVDEGDLHVQSIAHGVVTLEQLQSDYGAARRRVRVNKLRGVNFTGGFHDADIVPGGLRVFPRLVAAQYHRDFKAGALQSGIGGLDQLLGDGLTYGTSCLFMGPAGAGKSTIALTFACAAAAKGEKVFACLFDENTQTMKTRASSVGLPLERYIEEGNIELMQVDPAELAPGQFVDVVKQQVQAGGVRVVIIDSLNGYMQAMPDSKFLNIQLHELLSFLGHHGIVTIMTIAQQGVIGQMNTPIDLTYLADTVLLLRYFEQTGEIRKAISVIKKRTGRHESAIREFMIDQDGVRVGAPLREFHGVLTGVPIYSGRSEQMLPAR
ncbi:MAG TPA: ATPase domain-containing protein [Opitutaceae bacterium]|nr:ATPase domain-containing protein [Opitutaceae bacterium]